MRTLNSLLIVLMTAGIFSSCMKETNVPTKTVQEVKQETTSPLANARKGKSKADGVEPNTDVVIVPADLSTILTQSTLTAGQNYDAGTVTVGIYEDPKDNHHQQYFTIIMDVTATDWVVGTSHIYVGGYDAAPINGGGNPQIGQFPHGSGDIALGDILTDMNAGGGAYGGGTVIYTIPLENIDFYTNASGQTCYMTMIHAEVHNVVDDGSGTYTSIASETAWGSGSALNQGGAGGSWAMYNELCL